jgi:hypothetical protein
VIDASAAAARAAEVVAAQEQEKAVSGDAGT